MTIDKQLDGSKLVLVLKGRLDTVTSPELGKEIESVGGDIKTLILDFAGIEYISSAGLRVILTAQKKMSHQGSMTLIHVGEMVKEVFDLTGFSDILTIE